MAFCSLPNELRNKIYSYCLIQGTSSSPLIVRRQLGTSRALLQVSRAIREECLPMYWSQNHFRSASLSTRDVAQWIRAIGTQATRWLCHFYFLTDITALNLTFVQLRLQKMGSAKLLRISGLPESNDLLHCSKCWCGRNNPCLWNQQGPHIRSIAHFTFASPVISQTVDKDALTNIFDDNWCLEVERPCHSLAQALEVR